MEDAPVEVLEAVPEAVTQVVENPLIAIDSYISIGVVILYIVTFFFFNKQKKLQISFCLLMAAANFFRVGLGVQIGFPIFLGCLWIGAAAFLYFSVKQLAILEARNVLADIERIQAEINRIKNQTYKSEDVWPPNPK